MTSRIVIVDYGLGNLFNVSKAFAYQEIPATISGDPAEVARADGLVLPGVGAFGDGMKGLQQRGLAEPIVEAASIGKPILGICLGMQMLMDESFEMGRHRGLGLIRGSVLPFRQEGEVKIPHMGWNRLRKKSSSPFLQETPDGTMFYFVHSYYVKPENPDHLLAETEYGGINFSSIVGRDNIYGCQFHPEKSGPEGLKLLQVFARLVRKGAS
jgi:glutamine amidotransferase